MISELPLIFFAGLLGSSHCIGMCGGFTMILGMTAAGRRQGVVRQLAYSAGRVFTYAVLGAVAGLVGQHLAALSLTTGAVRVGAGLCILAGGFLVVEGLSAAGFSLRRKSAQGISCGGCLSSALLSNFLRAPGAQNAFLGGLLTGFLPCGLVYAFLALAAARGNPFEGLAVMTAFGLGTVPLMVVTGIGSTLLSVVARQRMLKAAAWCVVATGVLTAARGAGFLYYGDDAEAPACPFCASRSATAPTATP